MLPRGFRYSYRCLQPGLFKRFQSIKDYGLLIGFPALLLILSKPVTKSNKWMYPAAVLVGFGVIDILFKKSLYTEPSIYEFAICDFRYSFDADDYSYPI
jgi:hypothetical protein